ncbi:hypothetical protein [Haloplanus natans]|uniref:hypothetical protein n=1 Tax=Haloplanus natans TaxID=376171 RepID=UPI0012F73F26|nr:hypothetical protein [Haloplanus natans]
MRRNKILVSTAILVTVASVVASILSNQLFPSIIFGAIISSILLGILAVTTHSHFVTLFTIVSVSVVRNISIFAFPASVIGIDPNRDIHVISRIVNTGTTDHLVIGFYSEAPFYYLLAGIFEIVSNVTHESPLFVYSILMGVLIPCTSFIIADRLSNKKLANLAALFASIITLGVKFAYWPVPQTLAVLFCYIIFVLWIKNRTNNREMGISLVILGVLVFTHKVPLLFLFFSFSTVSIVAFASNYIYKRNILYWLSVCGIMLAWQVVVSSINNTVIQIVGLFLGLLASLWAWENDAQNVMLRNNANRHFPGVFFAILSGLFLIVQWIYATTFIQKGVLKISTLFSWRDDFAPEPINPSSAAAVDPGQLDFLYHYSETLLFMLGVAILLASYTILEQKPEPYLVSFIGIGLVLTGIVSTDPNAGSPFRFLLFIIPLGAVIISINFREKLPLKSFSGTQALGLIFVVLLLLFQTSSIFFVPDYSGTPRSYLDQSEMSAKSSIDEFGIDGRIVYTDQYTTLIRTSPDPDLNYKQSENLYLESSYSELEKSSYILYRDEKIIRLNGNWWRLKWGSNMLDRNFSRIYSSGDSHIYITDA